VGTSNHYTRALKMFSAWLARHGRIDVDPLRYVQLLNADTDRRRVRRAISADELARLIGAARRSETVVCRLDGAARALLYAVAATTGLRASTLASLTPASFELLADPPTVRTEAGSQKNRRDKVQPVPASVALDVGKYIADRRVAPAEPLWPGRWSAARNGAELIRVDLEAAGIPYVDDSGRVFDFHALGGQFASALARAGVHPRIAQELLGHSTIDLTMRLYTKLEARDLAAAVAGLPDPTAPVEAARKKRMPR